MTLRSGLLLLAGLVFAADQASKAFVEDWLYPGQQVVVLPVLRWVLAFNEGAAFSFLSDAGGWQRWAFVLLAAAFSVYLVVEIVRLNRLSFMAAGYALVLGGALGNAIDRLLQGGVTDFILVHWGGHAFPAFNIADSAITIGAIFWLGTLIFAPPEPSSTTQSTP